MSKSNTWENGLLDLLFNNTNFAGVGDATGLLGSSGVAGNLYVSLHTSNPNEAGDQTTSEATYGAYQRQAVVRSSSGWTVAANAVENAGDIVFPEATSGSETISHFGVGTSATAAGKLLYWGALTSSLAVSTGITPIFSAGDLDITED